MFHVQHHILASVNPLASFWKVNSKDCVYISEIKSRFSFARIKRKAFLTCFQSFYCFLLIQTEKALGFCFKKPWFLCILVFLGSCNWLCSFRYFFIVLLRILGFFFPTNFSASEGKWSSLVHRKVCFHFSLFDSGKGNAFWGVTNKDILLVTWCISSCQRPVCCSHIYIYFF